MFKVRAWIRTPKPTKRETVAKWNEYLAARAPWAGVFEKKLKEKK